MIKSKLRVGKFYLVFLLFLQVKKWFRYIVSMMIISLYLLSVCAGRPNIIHSFIHKPSQRQPTAIHIVHRAELNVIFL